MALVRTRIRILLLLAVCAWLVVIGKLYYEQIVRNDMHAAMSDRQYQRPADGLFDRGEIFFTAKDGSRIAAATNRHGYILYVIPKDLIDAEATFVSLVSVVPNLDRETFMARAAKEGDPYEEIARRVTQEQYEAIAKLDLSGVGFSHEAWRFYPGSEMASHILGFISRGDNGITQGRYGLERMFDSSLRREDDNTFVNFFVELFSGVKKAVAGDGKEGDIVTTIEPTVQAQVADVAAYIASTYSAKEVGIIVMDPRDGKIVGMASTPTYDPNAFNDVPDYAVYRNPIVESLYEMGSVIKPITMAIGLDAGVVTSGTLYEDLGSLTLDGRTFYNFDKMARGTVDMQAVLDNSLNTGVAFVVRKLGNSVFGKKMKEFFSDQSEIDLPNEAVSQLSNLDSPRDIEYATASFGQGIALTPIETVRALAALGNGGKLVKPHVVSEIDYDLGLAKMFEDEGQKVVLSAAASEEITRMLVNVVDHALLGGQKMKEDYSIAAKTGTAQMADPEGGYHEDKFLHSFFGYLPAYDPEFIIFLYAVEPHGEEFASHTLTEPFFELTDFLIEYYAIAPDRAKAADVQ
jgi:cell division protein FtsI/penicillin-binding protein 2